MGSWAHLNEELQALKQAGRYRLPVVWADGSAIWMTYKGQRMLQMSSNNYLGLNNHPELVEAAKAALDQYGVGSGSVRTITGTLAIHEALEQELAAFKGTEAALVFPSGFSTNQGVLSALLQEGDAVISDELNHASIIDGIRLTKATRHIYRHKDMLDLERALQASAGARSRLVVTDGVFSMDGDIAPLPAIVELAERYDAQVYVDDAHASGVLGRGGRGSVDHFGLKGRVAVQVGTLSKAVGVVGGYVAGDETLKSYLLHKARPILFSTSAPPAVAASCLAAIRLLAESEDRVTRLWDHATFFRSELQRLGFDVGVSQTPIIPVKTGTPAQTMAFSDQLMQAGVFAQGIIYPTVAMDKGRVRMIVTSEHTREDLDFAISALAHAGRQHGLIGS